MTVWDDTIVTLTPPQLAKSAAVAGVRHALKHGWDDRAGRPRDFGDEMVGACAEQALSILTGRAWFVDEAARGDVGGLECRGRRGDVRDETVALNLQPRDVERKPEVPFVLVVGRGPTYRIVGYRTPGWARAQIDAGADWIRDPGSVGRPAIFVPQPHLLPVDEYVVQAAA